MGECACLSLQDSIHRITLIVCREDLWISGSVGSLSGVLLIVADVLWKEPLAEVIVLTREWESAEKLEVDVTNEFLHVVGWEDLLEEQIRVVDQSKPDLMWIITISRTCRHSSAYQEYSHWRSRVPAS